MARVVWKTELVYQSLDNLVETGILNLIISFPSLSKVMNKASIQFLQMNRNLQIKKDGCPAVGSQILDVLSNFLHEKSEQHG